MTKRQLKAMHVITPILISPHVPFVTDSFCLHHKVFWMPVIACIGGTTSQTIVVLARGPQGCSRVGGGRGRGQVSDEIALTKGIALQDVPA